MPVIGDVHQIVIAVGSASTFYKPDRFQGGFAEQGTSEGDVLAVSPVDVLREASEGGVVHEDPVYTV